MASKGRHRSASVEFSTNDATFDFNFELPFLVCWCGTLCFDLTLPCHRMCSVIQSSDAWSLPAARSKLVPPCFTVLVHDTALLLAPCPLRTLGLGAVLLY